MPVGNIKTRDLIAGLVAINYQDYLESYRGHRVLNVAREIVAKYKGDVIASVLKSAVRIIFVNYFFFFEFRNCLMRERERDE